jgi:gluconolactonase
LDGGTRIFEMTDDRWGEGGPDGMKADEKGNFYCAGPRGVWVFSSVAEHLGIIEVPEPCANLAWGGDSHTDLFVTATTSLYRIGTLGRVRVPEVVLRLGRQFAGLLSLWFDHRP